LKRSLIALAATGVALAFAAPASTHLGPTLIIRHHARGCHTWGFPGGPRKVTQSVTLAKGSDITIGDNDVMAHTLVQLSGPRLKLSGANLRSTGAAVEIVFTKAGVYRFTTKPGAHYRKGVKTIGEDNVLKLKVVVR
jgi:hypothetical protein